MSTEGMICDIADRKGWPDSELLSALTGYLANQQADDALRDHLEDWPGASVPEGRQDGGADRTADAKRILFGRLLAAIPPGRRGPAEDWLIDLLYLAEGSLARDALEQVIRETLAEAGPGPGAGQDYEVGGETRTVRARSPQEAVALVLRQVAEEVEDRHYQSNPNPLRYVRLAHSRDPWQLVYDHDAAELPAGSGEDGGQD
jgi:hypothetical protein